MTTSAKRKCLHCREFFRPDHRNVHHQHYCSKSDCRRQSKVESQRRWLQKPENQNYFRGPDNTQRVKQWRKCNPGYWRKKKSRPEAPLQEVCQSQATQNQEVSDKKVADALQDLFSMQAGLARLVPGQTSAIFASPRLIASASASNCGKRKSSIFRRFVGL